MTQVTVPAVLQQTVQSYQNLTFISMNKTHFSRKRTHECQNHSSLLSVNRLTSRQLILSCPNSSKVSITARPNWQHDKGAKKPKKLGDLNKYVHVRRHAFSFLVLKNPFIEIKSYLVYVALQNSLTDTLTDLTCCKLKWTNEEQWSL